MDMTLRELLLEPPAHEVAPSQQLGRVEPRGGRRVGAREALDQLNTIVD